MTVTLNGIDIETLTGINEIQRPRIATTPLGIHPLILAQSMKGTIHQYQVNCIWTGGNSDVTAKKRKLQNLADGGMPYWFDAISWNTGMLMFGKISDIQVTLSEGRVDIFDVSFLMTAVFPWGYTMITDDGAGDFRLYDVDKIVQSRTINPILRNCTYTKTSATSGTLTYTIFVKNIGSTGTVKIEIMVPDGVGTGSISCSKAVTEAAGDVGAAGFSNTPGTKKRITMTRSVAGAAEEQWDITMTFGDLKTSYLDGSVDDIVP